MGSATAVEYEIEAVLESQDTGVCWRLRFKFQALPRSAIQFVYSL